MHFHVDGTITTARLKRPLIGGAVFTDVVVRQDDGDQRRIGTLMVHSAMKHAMTPGARGRFYFHNVLGTKGIHGFRPAGAAATGSFPGRWVGMFATIGLLNMLMVTGWLLLGDGFGYFTFGMGLMCLLMAGVYGAVSAAAMRAYRADESRLAALRPATAHG